MAHRESWHKYVHSFLNLTHRLMMATKCFIDVLCKTLWDIFIHWHVYGGKLDKAVQFWVDVWLTIELVIENFIWTQEPVRFIYTRVDVMVTANWVIVAVHMTTNNPNTYYYDWIKWIHTEGAAKTQIICKLAD